MANLETFPSISVRLFPNRWFAFRIRLPWGCSSVGRASGSQSEGRQFDPDHLHQINLKKTMKKILLAVCLSLLVSACSTTSTIKVPSGSKLYINGNPEPVAIKDNGEVTTRPFFWTAIAGIPYRLEQNEKVISQGKLRAKFRPVSIFWPPYGAIYWPVGFALAEYDLSNAAQNREVPEPIKPSVGAAQTK